MDDKLRKALDKGHGVAVRPLAEALGVTPNTLYKSIGRGEIAVYEVTPHSKRVTPQAARRLLGLRPVEGER